MPVFISHSFDDRDGFQNVADVLDPMGVPYWNPQDIKAAGSLREALREAVKQCPVCIFVATHKAVKSSWCGAELGAFWGAGKPIIVYLADSSLSDDALPPIVQGDVWEKRIARVAARAKELLDSAATNAAQQVGVAPTNIGNMTVEQLERVIVGAVALAAASGKEAGHHSTIEEIGQSAKGAAARMLEGIRTSERSVLADDDGWRSRILWVDDRPQNNTFERQAFESMGLSFTLARSTNEALTLLGKQRFAAIISDMGRKEGPREGYILLEAVRQNDPHTPYFIYAGSNSAQHVREALARGAQGTTNEPGRLVDMVLQALPERNV